MSEARPLRLVDRLAALLGVRLVVWILVGAALTPSLWTKPFAVTGHYDEHYFYAHDDAARITMVEYHELPAWNPYYCGGIPLAANPQDESLSPDFLLRVAFGTEPGRRLTVLLFLVLGMEGMFQLARRHRASAIGAAAAAVFFAAQGRFFFMLEFGWINMFGFELLPWAVLGYEEGRRSWRWALVGGFAVAWMLLAGGTYSVPYTVLALAGLAAFDTVAALVGKVRAREAALPWWSSLKSLALVGASGAAFSAAKLLPLLRVVQAHPRTIHLPQRVDAYQLLSAMLTSHLDKPMGLAAEGYLGAIAALLALVALLLRDRASSRFMTLGLLFFAFGMGEQGPWAPWSIVRHLPLYGQLRNPERFTLVIGFFVALAAGRALTRLEDVPGHVIGAIWSRVRTWRGLPELSPRPLVADLGFALLGVALAGGVAYAAAKDLVTDDRVHQVLFTQDAPLRRAAEFHQARGNRWDAQVWPPMARGTLQCFEETEFPQSPRLRADLSAEEYTLEKQSAKVARLSWSPNHIRLRVVSDLETTVLVNQNYAKAWSSNVGAVRSVDGLLAVAVPAGDHEVKLSYDDGLFDLGVLISLASLGFAVRHFARWARARLIALRSAL